ncbi:hypothetical protein TIFTF001_029470 [Ficus carica]|uniref:Uncharacterized protein n=1 Tax=Ficus carica TaxID=3494 RepID=A0AA88J3F1_FICCA|nr:hypothetical protein TIFTF001_029470 [Ficus carica]
MLNDLVHGLNWIGLVASTTPWLCTTDVVLTGHKLITYVHAVGKEKFKYDGNKLPRVVPTRTRSGRDRDGIRASFLPSGFTVLPPAPQFCKTARLRWHSEDWRRSYASSMGPKEWLHDMDILFIICHVGTYFQVMLVSRRLVDEARARCLGIGYLERRQCANNKLDVVNKNLVDYDNGYEFDDEIDDMIPE